MARRRFFVEEVRNGRAVIGGDDAHHLVRVLRVEVGHVYEISDTNRVWLAKVDATRKSQVDFEIVEELAGGPPLPETILMLALVKFDRFEWAMEKATELGVTRVVPFQASRSDQGLLEGARKRVERWRRIAKEASEQSRRLCPPDVSDPVRFDSVLKQLADRRILLDERAGAPPMLAVLETVASTNSIALAIGPEGGWTDGERKQLEAAGWVGGSLGSLILRAETAVCAALAIAGSARLVQNPRT